MFIQRKLKVNVILRANLRVCFDIVAQDRRQYEHKRHNCLKD